MCNNNAATVTTRLFYKSQLTIIDAPKQKLQYNEGY
jgi:hypothetical protein